MIECKFCGIIKLGKRDDMPHKEEPHGKLEKFLWGSFLLKTKSKKISVKKTKEHNGNTAKLYPKRRR